MDSIKRTVIGMKPHWWEVDSIKLQIHDNPTYIDSLGEQCATVSGEILTRDKKDPCSSGKRIPLSSKPSASGFDRWIDLQRITA